MNITLSQIYHTKNKQLIINLLNFIFFYNKLEVSEYFLFTNCKKQNFRLSQNIHFN